MASSYSMAVLIEKLHHVEGFVGLEVDVVDVGTGGVNLDKVTFLVDKHGLSHWLPGAVG